MKRTIIRDALNEISDAHIAEAADIRKRRKLPWLGAIAALLALALLFRSANFPLAVEAEAVSTASAARVTSRPEPDDYKDTDEWRHALDNWTAARDIRDAVSEEALTTIMPFLKDSCIEFLTGEGNVLYSPISAYIALAMAAEITCGNTRQQLLDALGAADTAALRSYTSALWESVYQNDGNEICTLASSLWLDDRLSFHQNVMDILAYDHYASVYQSDLGSPQAVKDIHTWLNSNTGGFLKESVESVTLPDQTVLALYSTIYFQSKWQGEFNASNNTDQLFHGVSGDTECTFMNAKQRQMYYYWGEDFGAVSLSLKNQSQMWFILPGEDKSVTDVLENGEYLDMIAAPYNGWEQCKYMRVNLSIPKFDIQAKQDLRDGLINMGITDLFHFGAADFSEAFDEPASIASANQAVRVAIDEKGVTAAAYTELPAPGEAMPPEEFIDFVLDRPFLFVIADNSGIPLFAGVVNQP